MLFVFPFRAFLASALALGGPAQPQLMAEGQPKAASRSDSDPDPEAWYQKWLSTNTEALRSLPRTLAFAMEPASSPGLASLLDIKAEEFNALSWIKVVSAKDYQTFIKLNSWSKTQPLSFNFDKPALWAQNLMETTGANMVIQGKAEQKGWHIFLADYSRKSGMSARPIAKLDPPVDLSPQALQLWLRDEMGYDGLILDHFKGMLLIAKTRPYESLGQGVIILNSATDPIITKKNPVVGGLFQIVDSTRELLIAQILVENNLPVKIPSGTKILLSH